MAAGDETVPSAAPAGDEQAILDMLIPRAQARIDAQLRDSDALDSKVLGVLDEVMAARTRLEASRQMLSELLASLDENNRRLPDKRRLFKAGLGVLVPGARRMSRRRPYRVELRFD